MAEFKRDLQNHADAVEALLMELLPSPAGPQAKLFKAMRYATLDGGKRMRPFLVSGGARLFDVPEHQALRVGVAIELIHGYSLVHDDLPAMDDAPTRRGRPSCHAAFGEATAVLAGDALQSLAFEVLADDATHPDPGVRVRLIGLLASAAGGAGMCGGQMIDLEAETRRLGMEETVFLQRLKTGALFRFASESGAILAGASSPEQAALGAYADDLGLAFQIKDDLLDIQGDPALTGKALRQDAEAGKATLVDLLGVDQAESRLSELQASAFHHLERFGTAAWPLRQLFAFAIGRSY